MAVLKVPLNLATIGPIGVTDIVYVEEALVQDPIVSVAGVAVPTKVPPVPS